MATSYVSAEDARYGMCRLMIWMKGNPHTVHQAICWRSYRGGSLAWFMNEKNRGPWITDIKILFSANHTSREYPCTTLFAVVLLSRDGSVVRALASYQCGPGPIQPSALYMWVKFLVCFCLAPRVFLDFSSFPPSKKSTSSNSHSTRIENPLETQLRLMWLTL